MVTGTWQLDNIGNANGLNQDGQECMLGTTSYCYSVVIIYFVDKKQQR